MKYHKKVFKSGKKSIFEDTFIAVELVSIRLKKHIDCLVETRNPNVFFQNISYGTFFLLMQAIFWKQKDDPYHSFFYSISFQRIKRFGLSYYFRRIPLALTFCQKIIHTKLCVFLIFHFLTHEIPNCS